MTQLVKLLILLLSLGASGGAAAQDGFGGDGLEDLLFQDIPIVISSTRTERSVLDVPNAVWVVTAEEIRASGVSSIEEILHWVPGLDVMRLSKGDVATSMRGFNTVPSATLLVMIDGRTVYLDFFGNVFWDGLNVAVQDIERIEFIRGPGSVLYGASALFGTVNIITKDPRDLPSVYSYSGLGSSTSHLSTTLAASAGRLAVKATAEYRSFDDFNNTVTPPDPQVVRDRDSTALRSGLGNATLDYLFDDGSRLTLSGGRVEIENQVLFLNQTLDQDPATTKYGRLSYSSGPWRLQTFYTENKQHITQSVNLGIIPAFTVRSDFFSSTADLEVQREVGWGKHQLLVGTNVRRLISKSAAVLGSNEQETLYGAFLQDEYLLTDNLTGYLGLRLDDHPKAGSQLSPRGSLVYRLSETGRIRTSISRSFRNPQTLGNYVTLLIIPPAFAGLVGNEDLDPESVTSYELGFRFSPRPRMSATVDVFYQVVDDVFTLGLAPAGPFLLNAQFVNGGRTSFWGGELAVDFRLGDRARGFASYSFVEHHEAPARVSPRHKASLGVRGPIGSRLRYALTGSYVTHTEVEADPSPLGGSLALINPGRHPNDIRSRFVVDGFLGLRVSEQFELGIKARNLFNQERRQFPIGDEIGSELLLVGTFEF